MIEELRRYRDLAIALIVSVFLCVAAFVVFLKMDMDRARQHFSAMSSIAIAHGERRTGQIIDFALEVSSHSDVIEDESLSADDLLLLDEIPKLVSTLCEHRNGITRKLYDNGNDEECILHEGISIALDRPWWSLDKQVNVVVTQANGDNQRSNEAIDSGVFPASLAFHINREPGHLIIITVDLLQLLNSFKPETSHEDSVRGIVCLELYTIDSSIPIACDNDPMLTERSSTGSNRIGSASEEYAFNLSGLQWLVRSRPSAEELTRLVSAMPFIVFGTTTVFCGVICWFIFRSADKTVKMDRKNRELARMVKKLELQNQDLDQFATLAAHDLQAPLRFMVANAHNLDMAIEEQEFSELPELSGIIIEQGGRMKELILDLLAFCRAGQDDLNPMSVNVGALIDDSVSALMKKKDYEGSKVIVGKLPESLICDEAKLIQIFHNLLDNALKYSQNSTEPEVYVNAYREEEWSPWRFVVEDNGCGISEEHRERIFRPFNRLDHSFSGTGVGLAIVKKLVERLQGQIWVEAVKDGHGTRLVFTLSDFTEEAIV